MTDRFAGRAARLFAGLLLSLVLLLGDLVAGTAFGVAPVAAELATSAAPAVPSGDAIPAGNPWDAAGAEERELLQQRLAALAVYAATFTQQIFGARGEVLEYSTGYMRLQRPRFKWVVEDPFPQTIITDGTKLKLYDPDLEQLTIRPLADALTDTPVSLLTRDDVAIGDQFSVMRIADAEDESWLIDPRGTETLYRQIQLHFHRVGAASAADAADAASAADVASAREAVRASRPVWLLSGLDILDHLGQRTEIRFTPDADMRTEPDDTFTLVVPPGTDVIGE